MATRFGTPLSIFVDCLLPSNCQCRDEKSATAFLIIAMATDLEVHHVKVGNSRKPHWSDYMIQRRTIHTTIGDANPLEVE